MTEKQTNYTEAQTKMIVEMYQEGMDVETIAVEMGRSTRSIVAKLSREGVYKSKQKAAAAKRMTKAEMIAKLEEQLGMCEGQISSLEKSAHNDLCSLLKAVEDLVQRTSLLQALDVA